MPQRPHEVIVVTERTSLIINVFARLRSREVGEREREKKRKLPVTNHSLVEKAWPSGNGASVKDL